MTKITYASLQKWSARLALGVLVGLSFGSPVHADITLSISNATGAAIDFDGTGSSATFAFLNNSAGDGFQVTGSSGNGSSVGLFGTIGGTFSFSYDSADPGTPLGPGLYYQSATVTTLGGTLAITDASDQTLTAQINAVNIDTVGTNGGINVTGAINVGDVTYSGTNTELLALDANAAQTGQLVISISFQFVPGESLSSIVTKGNQETSYSATIFAPGSENGQGVPEPGTLSLACIALGTIGVGMGWSRRRNGA